MYLIVGLGNPGAKYRFTRHNTGFNVIEVLSQRLDIALNKSKCKALLGEGRLGAERVVLAQPQTYMNLSGESVRELLSWYKCPLENMIVVYDDIDLPPGRIRIRAKGSAGTHNGMRNIIYQLGRDDFPRVRVGIGRQPEGWDLADYVVGEYHTAEERKVAFDSYLRAADAIEKMVRGDFEGAMRDCNAGV
ncbi:MAG: aminoacyl-tRNA hydrolase [Candidatus Fimadaptatus sp.]|jgi:PTH1 family peptidyl-tRNA hydrolase